PGQSLGPCSRIGRLEAFADLRASLVKLDSQDQSIVIAGTSLDPDVGGSEKRRVVDRFCYGNRRNRIYQGITPNSTRAANVKVVRRIFQISDAVICCPPHTHRTESGLHKA